MSSNTRVNYCCDGVYADQYQPMTVKLPQDDVEWDILVLSQHWPATLCKYWTHNRPDRHCAYPCKNNWWTMHGIWPFNLKSKLYPSFCNDSWVFDPEMIKPIQKELDQAWTNIFKESDIYRLWRHEWNKYGTCSTTIEALNSELKYFTQGIEWNKQYSLLDMLEAAKIRPSDTNELTIEELRKAIEAKTGKLPTIVCFVLDEIQYLDELRVCFDKQLNIIDCNELVFKTCNISKGIIFPTITHQSKCSFL